MFKNLSFFLLLLTTLVGQAYLHPTIDPVLIRSLQTRAQPTANILLSMTKGSTSEALGFIKNSAFTSRNERLNTVAKVLKDLATASQTDLLNFLDTHTKTSEGVSVTQLWVNNKVIVRGADFALVQKLMGRSDISKIEQEFMVPFHRPEAHNHFDHFERAGEQWGVVTIEAPAVWQAGINGSGIVVSTIDSGVRGSHEALVGNHRAEYGWFNPEKHGSVASDQLGHGTHTMGTIAGTVNGIGVAPGAQWVSCKPCDADWCSNLQFLECGQWITCPTDTDGNNPDCTKAPHLVSNSWGDDEFEFDEIIEAWKAAGIVAIFSSGNSGPSCSTVGYPGDHADVISVGSTTSTDSLSGFSSVGPTGAGLLKPDVAAPGSNVYSSCNTGDKAYCSKSGTSMAAPHVAGLVALILQQNPNLTYDQVKSSVEGGAVPVSPSGRNCGGINESIYPNYHVGHGRIDAKNSIANSRQF